MENLKTKANNGTDKSKNSPTDTQKGATVAEKVLKAEPRPGETKSIGEVMEAIRHKAKLVSDLQTTIDRRTHLQQMYSEKKLKVTISPIEYNGRVELEFTNENIVDFIVKGLNEKSKEVESDIAEQLIEMEK